MIYVVLFLLGLALGSFINALVWRIHEQSKLKVKSKKSKATKLSAFSFQLSARQNDLSILTGRSMCPHCRHQLHANDLIPVISWITLAGKCRYCKKPIHWSYPLVEVLTGILFIASYILWPYGFNQAGMLLFGSWLVLLTGLLALTVYDLKWMLLPNRIMYPLLVFWVVVTLSVGLLGQEQIGYFVNALLGLFACGGVFWLLFQVSQGKWIGGGDVKLGFLLGLVAGSAVEGLMIIFLASVIGLIVVVPPLLQGKLHRSSRVPFGPFLIVAAVIIFLSGNLLTESLNTYLFLSQ
jgi:prepilin signal peptidase PulO-like enzyme (type II secretory pathway)